MAESSFDLVIIGASPLACLVAGLLASQHGKRICLVGPRWSPFRLPRRFDLGLLPATRPETWALLKAGSAETAKLLHGLGKGLFTLLDPLLVAETPASIDALAHMRASAAGLGFAVERVAERAIAHPGMVWKLRDIPVLAQGRFEPVIDAWLDRVEVRRLAPNACTLTLRRDGSARIRVGELDFEAGRTVLADDEAILAHLDAEGRDKALRVVPAETVLTEPAKPLAAPHMAFLDRGVTLSQRGKSGVIALATGVEDIADRIGACLPGRLRRAATTAYTKIETSDGAPLVGPARGSKALVIAGFGDAGAFFAPALARWLAEIPGSDEAAYFGARGPGRGNSRASVADFVPEAAP